MTKKQFDDLYLGKAALRHSKNIFTGLKNPNENKDEKYLSSFISPEKK